MHRKPTNKMEELKEQYPSLLRVPFECGEGWHDVLSQLCAQLQAIKEVTEISITATQIKEKYGTLRFYYSTDMDSNVAGEPNVWWSIICSVVSAAENKTEHICEVCGEFGKTITINSFLTTLCPKCEAQARKEHL